ncbi:acyltransferase family protein [Bradyrhizobium erythrophlei]|uniref:acyltransferase family protein n=1 Tax=Bradyrhizobium erythrophlei TaxID=1437360 RepID=UPI0035ED8FC3
MNQTASAANSSRMASLDLLRLLAALAVVFFHYCFRGKIAGDLDSGYAAAAPFAIYGYLGVNLFFLISGFVISWSAEGRNWQEFSVARFVRLYPGFLVCMTATFVVLAIARDPRFPTDLLTYAANLSMFAPAFGRLAMDGVYWSIMLEIVFYGWFAALIFAGVYPRRKLTIVAVWLAVSALNETLLGSGALRILLVTAYAPFFASGILAYHLVSRGRSPQVLALLAASFLLSCKTITFSQNWMIAHLGVAPSYLHLVAANVAVHAIFAGAILLRSVVRPSPTILMLGGLTYPLYLLHQFIGYILLNALAPHIGKYAAFMLVLAGMLIASFLVWRFVEMPVRKPLIKGLMSVMTRLTAGSRLQLHRYFIPTGQISASPAAQEARSLDRFAGPES